MVEQLKTFTKLEIDEDYLIQSRKYSPNPMDTPWSCEPYRDPAKGWYAFFGRRARQPDPRDPWTREHAHKSVFRRIELQGKKYLHPDIGDMQEDQPFGVVQQKLRWPDPKK